MRTRVKRQMGWSEELADETVLEYRKFLALVILDPEGVYGMVPTVDEIWHQHLLDTRDYLEMCRTAMGGVIHHDQQPLNALGSDHVELRERTLQ